MTNVLIIAKKEFLELANSKLIIASILVYFIILLVYLTKLHDKTIHAGFTGYSVTSLLAYLIGFLVDYGSLVAIVVGFLTLSVERRNHSLVNLVVKPLYRDTIINGKLIGCMAFLLCMLVASSILYSAGIFVFFGSYLVPRIDSYITMFPLAILFSLIYIMIFFSFSMLMSVLSRNSITALFISILFWFTLTYVVSSTMFAGNLSVILGGGFSIEQQELSSFFAQFSPASMCSVIFFRIGDLTNIYIKYPFEILKMLLYGAIPLLVSYILFIRTDLS